MNYKLAKELKDVGWKFRSVDLMSFEEDEIHGECSYCKSKGFQDETEYSLFPTLSELIEACGDKFISLEKEYSWWAVGEDEPLEPIQYEGRTPEEAVAYLYLALNRDIIK